MKRETLCQKLREQAETLATIDKRGRPSETNLRRAVSATYYALFHYLIDRSTRQWVGESAELRSLRDLLGRGFQHSEMKEACKAFAGSLPHHLAAQIPTGSTIPSELRKLAKLFCDLQESRHSADYDLSVGAAPKRSDVLAQLNDLQQTIEAWESIADTLTERLFLVALVKWSAIKRHR